MENLLFILKDVKNAFRVILIAVVILVLFFILKFAFSVNNFFKVKIESNNWARTNVIDQKLISELITSQAGMDVYYFYKKDGNGYIQTGESISDFSKNPPKKYYLKDKTGAKNRQYCQMSTTLTFGYENPYKIAKNIFKGENDIYTPKILGNHFKDRIIIPTVPYLISSFSNEFLGEKGKKKLKAWMVNDNVLADHLNQGIERLSEYLTYLASDESEKKAIVLWKEKAEQKVIEEIEKISGRDIKELSPKKFSNLKLTYNRIMTYKNLDSISKKNQKEELLPHLTLGSYLETYSTIAFSSAIARYRIWFDDEEFAIQRNVTTIVYGVEAVGKDHSIGNVENIIATAPQIIYRNSIKHETGLFNDYDYKLFIKLYNKTVDQYMDSQVEKNLEEAISNNSNQAKRVARRSFEYELSKILKKKKKVLNVRYLDLSPNPPSLYDSVLQKYLLSIGN